MPETRKIGDLKQYHKNPRKITKEDFELLSESLREFGDLSGVVLNRTTGELVGGNQRTQFFRQNKGEIVITNTYPVPTSTGTVAEGHILFNGEKYAYREVEWTPAQEERANILANKVGGMWDHDLLANAFDIDVLKASGWKDFELGFASPKEDEPDANPLANSAETYLAGNVKQIVLYFSAEEYEDIVPRLDKVMTETGTTSHTEAFLKLLEEHENS